MQEKYFQKRTEDFMCENCGKKNAGNGYTNHCKECLWSRHVDINPGDRKEECGGMMEPTEVELKDDGYIILHACTACGHFRKNKIAHNDNMDEVIRIASKNR